MLGLGVSVRVRALGLGLKSELGSGLERSRVRNAWVRKGYNTKSREPTRITKLRK